jgi:hypothetical protein
MWVYAKVRRAGGALGTPAERPGFGEQGPLEPTRRVTQHDTAELFPPITAIDQDLCKEIFSARLRRSNLVTSASTL